MRLDISEKAHKQLSAYLLLHEEDIAYGINDFAALGLLFFDVFDRLPIKQKITKEPNS